MTHLITFVHFIILKRERCVEFTSGVGLFDQMNQNFSRVNLKLLCFLFWRVVCNGGFTTPFEAKSSWVFVGAGAASRNLYLIKDEGLSAAEWGRKKSLQLRGERHPSDRSKHCCTCKFSLYLAMLNNGN